MSKARELADLGNAYSDGALSNRNLIINGAMQVAQRGTSSSSGGYSTVDRYYHNLSGATSTVTREEATLGQEIDGQFEYWLKANTTTGNNYCGIQQRVENVRSLRQGKATLSFWAKGTNPASGQYLVQLQRLPAGSSGTTLDVPLDDTYTVSSTWTRKTFTFDVPALGTSVTENGNSQLYITLGAQKGQDTSTNAWELNITGVQLEVGDTATPFEHRSYGDELQRCMRYFQVLKEGRLGGVINGTGHGIVFNQYIQPSMRSSPTTTVVGVPGIAYMSGSSQFSSTVTGVTASGYKMNIVKANGSTGDGLSFWVDCTSSNNFTFDAEL